MIECEICHNQDDVSEAGIRKIVCNQCRADAQLGAAVRGMKPNTLLERTNEKLWWWKGSNGSYSSANTPEEALRKAGLMR